MDQLLSELPQDLQAAFKEVRVAIERLHRVAIHEPDNKMDIAEHKEWAMYRLENLATHTASQLASEGIYLDGARLKTLNIEFDNGTKIIAVPTQETVTTPLTSDRFFCPKSMDRWLAVRDAQIREAFNGYNHHDLARDYCISPRAVLKICDANEGDDHE